jgi:hypothetical protein
MLSFTTHPDAHQIRPTGSKPHLFHLKPPTMTNILHRITKSDTKTNENTGVKPYIINSTVFYQIRARSYISIGARSVVTTWLSFAVGVDTLEIFMMFLIKTAFLANISCELFIAHSTIPCTIVLISLSFFSLCIRKGSLREY